MGCSGDRVFWKFGERAAVGDDGAGLGVNAMRFPRVP